MNKIRGKRAIVVVGPGRSGTSVITRALKVLGVDLGDNLMPPKAGVNDKGFWEDQDIYSLNMEIFKELKHGWHKLTPPPLNLLDKGKLSELKLRAVEVLRSKLKVSSLFGMKDPQMTRLLPFWRDVFGQMGVKDDYVIACRNPMSVARSLSKYAGIGLERAYLLWFEYTVASLTDPVDASRVVVDYDLMMQNPTKQLNRIGNALNLKFEPGSEEFAEYQAKFLEAGLRHTEFQIADLRLDQEAPPKVLELYEFMIELAADKMCIDDQDAIAMVDRFAQFQHGERFLLRYLQNDEDAIEISRKEIAERDTLIGNLGQTIESLVTDRDSQKAGIGLLQDSLEKLAHERDEQVSQLNLIVVECNNQISELRTELNLVVDERNNQISELRTELSAVYKSKSWRLTAPLRWLVKRASNVYRGDADIKSANLEPKFSQDQNSVQNADVAVSAQIAQNNSKFRILLVSHYCPTRAHAGGLRILDIYALIRKQCPNVQIDLLTFHRPSIDWSLDAARHVFHNIYLSPTEELTPEALQVLSGSPLHYDVVDLQFHQSGYQIDAFRRIGSKIIFTPMESLAKVAFINLRTNLLTTNSSQLLKVAASLRAAAEEVVFALKVDEVICVSRADASFLRAVTSSRRVRGIDTGVSQFEFADALTPSFICASASNRRCNILFVAYFGSETNVSALRWYLENVHPIVKAAVPAYVLTVVGRGDLSTFSNYRDSSIEFVGEVDAVAPYIQEARVGIAAALSGSGFRGKVNQYAILGVPSVVSPIAHKGLAYQDGVNIFVEEKPEAFAERCVRLLTDFKLNDHMGQSARELCLANYTWQSKWPAICSIYNLEKEVAAT